MAMSGETQAEGSFSAPNSSPSYATNHNIDKVTENEKAKALWDFRVQTDKHLPHTVIVQS